MLLPATSAVPGAENGPFSEWLAAAGILVHPGLSVEASALGGMGLFFEDSLNPVDGDVEVARIPASAVFDYMGLLEVLKRLKEEDGSAARILTTILATVSPETESEILNCYFWGFKAICNVGGSSLIPEIAPYVGILGATAVLDVGESDCEDLFVQLLVEEKRLAREIYDAIMAAIGEFFEDTGDILLFGDFHHILQAVKSRVLEIPHSLEEDSGEGDFYTNITLVPLLDFCNHLHENNAYFDVDRKSNDVILRAEKSALNGSKIELAISYSPTESIQHFFKTYGFVPQQFTQPQLFELQLSDLNEHVGAIQNAKTDYSKAAKWLHILPYAQLVVYPNEVKINFLRSTLHLLFTPGLTYNLTWDRDERTVRASIAKANDILKDDMESVDTSGFIEAIRYQEESCDVVNHIGSIGVLVGGNPLSPEVFERERTAEDLAKMVQLVVRVSKSRAAQLDRVEQTGVVEDYLCKEREVLHMVISAPPDSLVLASGAARSDWANYRLPAKQISIL